MCVSKNISVYIRNKGINLSALSRATGIPRGTLHSSLSVNVSEEKRRSLRDDELIAICKFLEKNPMDFADSKKVG